MDDWVSVFLMGLVLTVSIWMLLRPHAAQNNMPGHAAFDQFHPMPPSGSARAGNSKTIRADSLTPSQKKLHARLPQKSNARSICLSGNVLLDASTRAFPPASVGLLVDFVAVSDLFVIFYVRDEAEKKAIQDTVASVPQLAWDPKTRSGIPAHKFLFCSSVPGNIALVRQIEPLVHIEDNREVAVGLRPFLPSIIYLHGNSAGLPPLQASQRDSVTEHSSFQVYYDSLTSS
ncbi:Aste57867_20411 [Aphanomyces stellatus]|uniref:Aste57867_20411 protein n=1 Tax=Aphanomyces stellatus TaxID=120398 RepID=A0A485LEX1_9STRA|nr:hypothetical protein As57867_020345 [Aphanomyces stellatus]VFT97097.1 Aste57867_20411 [Aphanomyces stellatus]